MLGRERVRAPSADAERHGGPRRHTGLAEVPLVELEARDETGRAAVEVAGVQIDEVVPILEPIAAGTGDAVELVRVAAGVHVDLVVGVDLLDGLSIDAEHLAVLPPSEGDPLVRSRLRERMRELLTRNMIRNVPRADVVVTNPTHYAVALEWNRELMEAPAVLAKGMDNLAIKIREVAEEHEIPCMENKPLARALYAEVEIGDVIPEKYYEVMALILAEVYKMKGRTLEAV